MLHVSLMLSRPYKRRGNRFSRFSHAFRFHQEQFAISQSQKWFAALIVGASTQHVELPFGRDHRSTAQVMSMRRAKNDQFVLRFLPVTRFSLR